MESQQKEVYKELEELQADEECNTFERLCRNAELKYKRFISNEWNITVLTLKTEMGISNDVIEKYCRFSKFVFDCGDTMCSNDIL